MLDMLGKSAILRMKALFAFVPVLLVLVTTVGGSVHAFAQFASGTNMSRGSSQFATGTPAPAPTVSPTPAPIPSMGPSINPAALQGQNSQNQGSGANAAAGAALLAACMASQPPMIPLCVMGALALAQSGQDDQAANQSGQTGSSSVAQGSADYASTAPTPTPYSAGAGTGQFSDPAVAKGLQALSDAGISVDTNGTVHMPDGSTHPASAFNSGSSMAAAGFDSKAAEVAKKVLDGLRLDTSKIAGGVAVESNAGGGGGSSGYAGGSSDSFHALSPFAMNSVAQKKIIAGKTVMFDGVPIGVRGNNIFEMVHEAYDKKRNGNQFIDGGGTVPATATARSPAKSTSGRMPASLPSGFK